MENVAVARVRIKKVKADGLVEAEDDVAIEEPLEIRLDYGNSSGRIRKVISVTMRTPGNDEELAVGFLFTEGILLDRSQVVGIESPPGSNTVVVILDEKAQPRLPASDRNFYATSSCGVCGKAGIDAIRTVSPYKGSEDKLRLRTPVIFRLTSEMRNRQVLFQQTGGLHASALFYLDGNFLTIREDVGRHNALDKLIGAAFLDDALPLDDKILFLSGRTSFELIQKASMAGINFVAAVGAPSSLAIALAEESGLTLIGFLGNDRFNIYSGHQRIV
jgi:FdhD protein